MEYNNLIGDVIEKTKQIEFIMNTILCNHIEPSKNYGFFQNVILNSSIISFGGKLKLIRTMCNELDYKKIDFDILYKLARIRNTFAHEISYVDDLEGNLLLRIDELKSDGKYVQHEFNKRHNEFLELYFKGMRDLDKLNQHLLKLNKPSKKE